MSKRGQELVRAEVPARCPRDVILCRDRSGGAGSP